MILDVVAFHVRRVRIEEEAPVRLVAAEQLLRVRGAVPELQEREPAVAALLAHQAERVVLAEEPLPRIVGEPRQRIHVDDAAQPAAAAEIAARIVDCRCRCRDTSLATVNSKANVPRASSACW